MGNGASGAKNQRDWISNQCFYLTISCIETWYGLLRIFGQVWGRKHKRQIMDYKTSVDTFKTETKNLCGRCNQNYHTSKYSWVIWLVCCWESGAIIRFHILHVSFQCLHQCVPVDMTPSSCVCCGTRRAPTPCAVQSVHKTQEQMIQVIPSNVATAFKLQTGWQIQSIEAEFVLFKKM